MLVAPQFKPTSKLKLLIRPRFIIKRSIIKNHMMITIKKTTSAKVRLEPKKPMVRKLDKHIGETYYMLTMGNGRMHVIAIRGMLISQQVSLH
jgi:hypothetical protein